MIVMLLLLLLIPFASSFELSENPEKEKTAFNPEVERLSGLVGTSEIATFYEFYSDIRAEAGRLNISEQSYAETCIYAFTSLKPSPLTVLVNTGMMRTIEDMQKLNITDRFPSKWAEQEPLLHAFVTNRRAALKRLAKNALPETAEFMRKAERLAMDAVFGQKFNGFEDWRKGARKIGGEYNKLSKEAKRDLERAFCARNTFNWINAGSAISMNPQTGRMSNKSVPLFDLLGLTSAFSSESTLNVSELQKQSSYFAAFTIGELTETFRKRAAAINMPGQDYVDVCAETITTFKLSDQEKADLNISTYSLGDKQEQLEVDNPLEMLEINRRAILNYLNASRKRAEFIKSRIPHLSDYTKEMIEAIESDIILGKKLRIGRDPIFVGGDERFEDHPDYTVLDSFQFGSHRRQFEQVYCLQSTLEAILEKEIILPGDPDY